MTIECPTCSGTGRVFRPEVVVRRMERSLKRAGADHKERQLSVRLHPEVALYLVEQEPNFLRQLERQTGLELEMRDDPMMRLDEFRMMAKPAGRGGGEQHNGGCVEMKGQFKVRPHDVRGFLPPQAANRWPHQP